MERGLKAPFPYFGGKSMVADIVWSYLGDVKQYMEPFFGSGAVLLKRPPTNQDKIYEIVCDKDGFISNVWRSIQFSPDETAKWCDWPINHADLMARKKSLLQNESRLLENLCNDPEWHDPKQAGYWIWCASCWIGSGLTRPTQIPHLANDKGVFSTQENGVYGWLRALSARLRNVKVVCGDWTRICGGNWQARKPPVGFFFDPPYATSGRDESIYHHDSMTVGKDVEAWCLERGKNPDYRIVVAGYDDEYQTLIDAGWRIHEWKANGGYGNLGGKESAGSKNRHRERLIISPHCLKTGLF
jgi:DNA adenine methylase